jgi:hypothetical protein
MKEILQQQYGITQLLHDIFKIQNYHKTTMELEKAKYIENISKENPPKRNMHFTCPKLLPEFDNLLQLMKELMPFVE